MHVEKEFSTDAEIRFGGSFSCSHEIPGQSSRNLEKHELLLENSKLFYEKLMELHESSGLNLVSNVRDTSLDLHLFYKEVIERGGFQQVTKDERWDEVASTLNLNRSYPNLSLQLQKLYKQLLYQFERIYLSCSNGDPAPASVDLGTQIGKTVKGVIETEFDSGYLVKVMVGSEKLSGLLYQPEDCVGRQFAIVPSLMDGVGSEDSDSEPVGLQIRVGMNSATHVSPVQTLARNKGMKKDPDAPLRLRSAYQIFLSKECGRLKKMHGGSLGQNIRKFVIDKWKHLSVSDRQPYVEESQKDRERYYREMIAYRERHQKTQITSKNENSWDCNQDVKLERQIEDVEKRVCDSEEVSSSIDDYHVTLQTDQVDNNLLVPDESMVELAVRMMEHAKPDDPMMLQINWDDFCGSLDIPN